MQSWSEVVWVEIDERCGGDSHGGAVATAFISCLEAGELHRCRSGRGLVPAFFQRIVPNHVTAAPRKAQAANPPESPLLAGYAKITYTAKNKEAQTSATPRTIMKMAPTFCRVMLILTFSLSVPIYPNTTMCKDNVQCRVTITSNYRLVEEVLGELVAAPNARKRPNCTKQNAPATEVIAVVKQRCAEPGANAATNKDADSNHKLHE